MKHALIELVSSLQQHVNQTATASSGEQGDSDWLPLVVFGAAIVLCSCYVCKKCSDPTWGLSQRERDDLLDSPHYQQLDDDVEQGTSADAANPQTPAP